MGNELRPRSATCVGIEPRVVSVIREAQRFEGEATGRGVLFLILFGEARHHPRASVCGFVKCDMSWIQVLHLCGPGGQYTTVRHKNKNTQTHAGAQRPEMKCAHTHKYKHPVDERYKHMGALKHAWQTKVSRGQQVTMRGGGIEEEMKAMVYSCTAI